MPAPPFELSNQFGQEATLSQLKGKIVVLTFLYTHCPDVCPLLISKIQQAVSRLEDPAKTDIALTAVTVDPERDTVEGLHEYSSLLPFNWLFLTGEESQLKVMWENCGIYVEKQNEKMSMEGENMTREEEKMTVEGQSHTGHQGYEVIHTAKVVLIDREGFLRSELSGTKWQVEELEDKLRRLLRGQDIPHDSQLWQSFVSFVLRCGPVSFDSLGGAIAHLLFIAIFPIAVTIYLLRLRRTA